MTTAVDTNVLIDILANDPAYAALSAQNLEEARRRGRLVVCEVVIAELGRFVADLRALNLFLDSLGLEFVPVSFSAACLAGRLWAGHRVSGVSKRRAVADFLIAAHAMAEADRLLTRDRDFLALPLEGLEVVIPRG